MTHHHDDFETHLGHDDGDRKVHFPNDFRYFCDVPRAWGKELTPTRARSLLALAVVSGQSGQKKDGFAVKQPTLLLMESFGISAGTALKHLADMERAGLIEVDRDGLRQATAARLNTGCGYFRVPLAPFAQMSPNAAMALLGICDSLTRPGRPKVRPGQPVMGGPVSLADMAMRSGKQRRDAFRAGAEELVDAGIVQREDQPGEKPWWTLDLMLFAQPFGIQGDGAAFVPDMDDIRARAEMAERDPTSDDPRRGSTHGDSGCPDFGCGDPGCAECVEIWGPPTPPTTEPTTEPTTMRVGVNYLDAVDAVDDLEDSNPQAADAACRHSFGAVDDFPASPGANNSPEVTDPGLAVRLARLHQLVTDPVPESLPYEDGFNLREAAAA